ncbi:SCO family protein [Deinococcus metallilatus]|uniref:Protein SCO1/2 n=1 Tax=Deinococcus metallilatus TaxID=1211322 RepID=A0AAJ5F537_9DEIO|nr:SCO family protein [Deinococcus metallilatus]MBB5295596.1 protein SCO1/2 [Deinococcus metallilatus]QBY07895.1 SCO family protein [Deinococcus metallilatus]RXJ12788.1 SCO family protein [Deinococcus metallilatus]TLK27290.1 SCO family protein [Deinococcus metallilatus]GMA16275.1 electron transporter [Deinococcus metallilatus]
MKWLTAALLALAAVLGGLLLYRNVSPAPTGGTVLDNPVKLPALRLVNDRGQATALNDSGGKLRLMFYGYVRCPDVCPATLAALKNIYAGLTPGQRKRVQVQLVTVDPVHDRPAVLRDYLNRFDPAFTGLTGDAATIDEAARVMFVANVQPQPVTDHSAHQGQHSGGAGADPENHEDEAPGGATEAARIHGDQVSVVDPQGRFVRVYNNAEVIGGELERDLPGLIRKYGS